MLVKFGIVRSKNKSYDAFMKYIEPDFINNKMLPKDYVSYCWKHYVDSPIKKNNALNGAVFEVIIATLFVKEGIMPFHLQAKVAFVPNVDFDMVLYSKDVGPIAISIKTSLRERYKQADLESIALKYVHRKAENYLLTLDRGEAEALTRKILNGDVMGIDRAILATSVEFDLFVEDVKSKELITPGKIEIISSSRIVTKEKVADIVK